MAQYKVISSRLTDLNEGDIVSDADLSGLNVQALIDGQHLAIVNVKPKQDDIKDK